MNHPESLRFNITKAILQHLVRARRCLQPTPPPFHSCSTLSLTFSPTSPSWPSDEEHQYWPTLLCLLTDLPQDFNFSFVAFPASLTRHLHDQSSLCPYPHAPFLGMSRTDQPPEQISSAPIALSPQALGCTQSNCTERFTNNIEFKNETMVSKFIFLGLTNDQELEPLIFIAFLVMYLITILGNLLIILAVTSDSHLHTPMYFFLSNLSFIDICMSTTTIPKMLMNIQTQDHSISYTSCLLQACFVLTFGCLENCLLAVMAYDCYVAICHPVRYRVILTWYFCVLLVLLSMLTSTVHALLHTLVVLRLSFCIDLEITHFFCELSQVIKLTCSDTLINTLLIYSAGNTFFAIPMAGIIFSYTKIVSVLRMPSVRIRYKAFSTCESHLSAVFVFYGTSLGVYSGSEVIDSSIKNAVASVMYIVIPQMMNPFIYSLRNKEMKRALMNLIIENLLKSCVIVSESRFLECVELTRQQLKRKVRGLHHRVLER
ncbi:olfactory receptor 7G2-like [Heterocephalus glaber]|uniref:Olfactory receptor 7G2-like n=1 Tax=Heterocephalus glaber TaxID=10181 RepID=A0AAX6SGM3_HETGA|nr:olfactory receptor 7G2-like [Heterocephalus glaber]